MNWDSASALLGLNGTFQEADVKNAYRSKALELHPDRQGQTLEAHLKMVELNQAHNLILAGLRMKVEARPLPRQRADDERDYGLYKQAMTNFRRVHPSSWIRVSAAGLFDPSVSEAKVPVTEGILEAIASISSAFSLFSRLVNDFPDSKWRADSLEKLGELEKMAARYRTMLKNSVG